MRGAGRRAGATGAVVKRRGRVVAPDLSPADVTALAAGRRRGVALARGGPTSHAAILARALGLPAVVGAGEHPAVPDGKPLVVDGNAGMVTVAAVRRRSRRSRGDGSCKRGRPPRRAPRPRRPPYARGVTVRVEANIAGPQDVPAAVAAGADGVGLLRTEYLFLEADRRPERTSRPPRTRPWPRPSAAAPHDPHPGPGADKPLAFLAPAPEANPFLGVRGLRLSLAQPGLLRTSCAPCCAPARSTTCA